MLCNHCKRCEVPRRSTSVVTAVSRELYIAALLPELRVLARAQLCQLAACQSRAAQLGLASPQRSRAARIAHSLQRSRTTLISAVDLR